MPLHYEQVLASALEKDYTEKTSGLALHCGCVYNIGYGFRRPERKASIFPYVLHKIVWNPSYSIQQANSIPAINFGRKAKEIENRHL
jgi:hypothetical protein